jgi:hypothetical protein
MVYSQVAKPASGFQPARAAITPLPDVLEELVGQGVVAQLAQQVAVQLAAMAGIQLLECRGIARRVGEHQGFVAGIQAIHVRQRTDWRLRREGRAAGGGGQGKAHAQPGTAGGVDGVAGWCRA